MRMLFSSVSATVSLVTGKSIRNLPMAWCSPLNPSQRHYVSSLLCCLDFRPELPGLDFDFDSCLTPKQGDGHNCSDDSDTGLQPQYRALSLILISGYGRIHKCKNPHQSTADMPAATTNDLHHKSAIGAIPRPPKFQTKEQERDYLKFRLAQAFRIFGEVVLHRAAANVVHSCQLA